MSTLIDSIVVSNVVFFKGNGVCDVDNGNNDTNLQEADATIPDQIAPTTSSTLPDDEISVVVAHSIIPIMNDELPSSSASVKPFSNRSDIMDDSTTHSVTSIPATISQTSKELSLVVGFLLHSPLKTNPDGSTIKRNAPKTLVPSSPSVGKKKTVPMRTPKTARSGRVSHQTINNEAIDGKRESDRVRDHRQ